MLKRIARRLRRGRSNVWRPPCPGAYIDEPRPAATVDERFALVRGWAMFPEESVTRLELTVDGRIVGLARLGLPRSDVAATCNCAGAPISGWEYELGPGDGIRAGAPITLGGTAYGSAGGKYTLPSVTVDVAAPASSEIADPLPLVSTLATRKSARTGSGPNILVFTHSLTYGGAQLYSAELLERLSSYGLRFTVVSAADGPLRERLERAGAAVQLSPLPQPWEREAYEARVAEVMSLAASQPFELVIVNTIVVFYGLDVATRLGLPSVLAAHESIDLASFWRRHLWPQDPAVFDRLTSAVASATKVVFEAAASRELYLPYADPDRLVTMPYGIDLAAIDRYRSTVTRREARTALGIGRDKKLVLCLGTIEPRKSQASLARAFARTVERYPDAVLALVGRGSEPWNATYVDGLTQHLERTGMVDRVLVVPLTPDPFQWHVAADVLVSPSDNESLPRVILEAMAFETLVVATDVFGIPEVVEDQVTGYLCRSRDEHDIGQKLSDVLTARPEHAAIRAAAAERVRQRHDADAYAAEFQDLIDSLVDEPPAVSSVAL